ncbi:helix-turn-helix domain-containing protein [Thermaerobacillus caldiproteolyticus]|uniref:helix-turn-helix domain-containing protein n=1 Tax=Thermaerobacillus caldiproteolyticus TaxID=247480 RepID=UPI001F333BC5|nr:helix-turn-helix domain-containing protein [Anoxybacillus caldiproteolyticus]
MTMGIVTLQIPDIDNYVKDLVRQAYELGVEEGREKYSYPPLLTRKDLAEIFQVQLSTVSNLTDIPGFPKFEHIRARYPRDQVFRWIEENSTYLEQMIPNRKDCKK